MNKLLASGCSITHGLGTVSNYYDLANIEFSYAKIVADSISAEYVNVAHPGASNEFIFHKTVGQLLKNEFTHCLIGWTSMYREAWEKDDIIWTFNLNYGSCRDYNSKESLFIKQHPVAKIHSNIKNNLNDVLRYWEVFTRKILTDNLDEKLQHYRDTIKFICNIKNIHLVEISALQNSAVDLELLENFSD